MRTHFFAKAVSEEAFFEAEAMARKSQHYGSEVLQHAATHCGYTATCCNMLQHATTRCNKLQRVAACCSILQHVAACCGVTTVCCSVLQYLRAIVL